ncbi:MAG: hypothetical protein WKF84_00255 [Pyrinomonadaceae bacterium]
MLDIQDKESFYAERKLSRARKAALRRNYKAGKLLPYVLMTKLLPDLNNA